MNHKAFVETMIDTLKFDANCKDYRDKILPIIRRSKINSVPQYAFAVRPEQRYENVEIRVPVPLINEANALKDDIIRLVSYVYEESDDYALGDILIKPQVVRSDVQEIKEHDVVFSEIEETIIQGIRDAKFLIWAAIAWFSNEKIYNELLLKKKHGLNIRIAISDEDTNQKLITKLKENFELVIVPRFGWKDYNRLHDKFCIIDLDYVMHGSYNWTPTANSNEETLATALDKDYVEKFADEFMRLYTKTKQ